VKGQEAHQNGAAVHFTEPWQPVYDTEYWSGVRSGGLNYRQFQVMNGKVHCPGEDKNHDILQ
jgi:hypothetical protein